MFSSAASSSWGGATPSSLFGAEMDALNAAAALAPASPTAALDELSTESRRKAAKRRSLGKAVKFEGQVKPHDGLSPRSNILDAVVKRYFVMQREVSELDVIDMCNKNVTNVVHLHQDLLDVLERLEQGNKEGLLGVPVLPRGGGTCTKLCPAHIPYVKILDRVVEAASQRLARTAYSS